VPFFLGGWWRFWERGGKVTPGQAVDKAIVTFAPLFKDDVRFGLVVIEEGTVEAKIVKGGNPVKVKKKDVEEEKK